MNHEALLNLLTWADRGLVDIGDKSRAAAAYRQLCRVIDRERGVAVLLTRNRGSLGDILPDAGAPIAHWYALSVTSFDPDGGGSRAPDLDLMHEVAWTIFGTHTEHLVATVDTSVPGSVAGVLFCDRHWIPIPVPGLPSEAWVAWPNREWLKAMTA